MQYMKQYNSTVKDCHNISVETDHIFAMNSNEFKSKGNNHEYYTYLI